MSLFEVPVVRVGPLAKHPNADSLSITRVFGFPVIIRTGDFQEGDLAAYIPVGAVVPDKPEWAFLKGNRRIRAVKLRGVFSMGLLAKLPSLSPRLSGEWEVGDDAAYMMEITKYEEPADKVRGEENEPNQDFIPTYTDIQDARRFVGKFREGEEVVVTEKIHGGNTRFLWQNGRLWVGSHEALKKEDPKIDGWRIADALNLRERLQSLEFYLVFGECYGSVQDLKYGAIKGEVWFRAFDVMDTRSRTYLGFDESLQVLSRASIPHVPILARGKWSPEFEAQVKGLTSGQSLLGPNIREGVVVRPAVERWDDELQRVILKFISEDYLLRKGGTERR